MLPELDTPPKSGKWVDEHPKATPKEEALAEELRIEQDRRAGG